jgi:hypothetical protein
MRIVPFPQRGEVEPSEEWLAELESALSGTSLHPQADSWRQLREDVRALAAPMAPEFQRELQGRVAAARERSAANRPARRLAWLLRPRHLGAIGAVAVSATVAILLISAPGPQSPAVRGTLAPVVAPTAPASAPGHTANEDLAASPGAATANQPVSGEAASSAPSSSTANAAPGRVQQLAASITLAATRGAVAETADRVSALAVSDGGYVQSSHVNVGQSTGEATMTLSLPSAKLSGALAALGRLAPVRSESQSLQDITGAYDSARQRLTDATAEQRALLRALAKATTAGQIDSLRERLSQTRSTIARDRSALQTVSQQAATAEVEVTVIPDTHAANEGLSLHRGLHDAARVLVVALVVLLIAAAVLVPLALVIALSVAGTRAWLRYQRERALGAR